MLTPPSRDRVTQCQRISRAMGGIVVLGALLVMAGWMWDVPLVRNPFPGTVSMKFNTALAFLTLGSVLILAPDANVAARRRWLVAKALSAMVMIYGGFTLAEYIFAFDSGISQALIQEPAGALLTVHLGRPAPVTAINFLLLSLALLHSPSSRSRWSQIPTLIAATMTMVTLFGYIYRVSDFYALIQGSTGIALTTVLLFMVLVVGVLATYPDHAVMRILTNPGSGGILARRLLPVALLLPLVAEMLSQLGITAHFYDNDDQDVVHALLMTVILVFVCLKTARILMHVDDKRRQAEEQVLDRERKLRLLLDTVDDGIYGMDREGLTTFINPAAARMLGWRAEDLLGRAT
ncbi:MAG: PAS domain S-box protein, partial [Alphaproteobacteria bacterium]|nr:PAS domain S-box protein [Alphaproteobacteria bacterium]